MSFSYVGQELELFSQARNWKNYYSSALCPFVQGSVLEVGAGLGSSTLALLRAGASFTAWTCLEPDPALRQMIPLAALQEAGQRRIELTGGFLTDLPQDRKFDTILYLDVLEHIADDNLELKNARSRLHENGRIVILAPAHAFLFSNFDRSIGHFRRYNTADIRAFASLGFELEQAFYLDSCGLLASLLNAYWLKKQLPSAQDIALWDSVLVRGSKLFDFCTAYRMGKSVVGVLKKTKA